MVNESWLSSPELNQSLHDAYNVAEHQNNPDNTTLQAVRFSRSFVPSYFYCLAILVFVAAALRFYKRSSRRTILTGRVSGSSSSSVHSSAATTVQGDESPPISKDAQGEYTPLLAVDGESRNDRSAGSMVWRYIRSISIYQPPPLPALTSPVNRPPPNGTTLMLLLVLGTNVFYLFYNIVPSIATATILADRAGLCFVVNLPVLYLLGAKNSKPLKWLTGWSYEGLNIVHRRLGEWMMILALVHAVGMMVFWYNVLRPAGYDLGRFLALKIIAIGLAALISYLLIYVTSIGYFRQRFYELFLASHIVLQLAALILLFLHHPNARLYCGAALVIWAVDRFVTRVWVSWKPFVATLQVVPDDDTVLLFCDIPLTSSRRGGIRTGWQAGQHVFISIPELGLTHRYQSHPYTIASPAPPSSLENGDWPLQLIIRSRDGFTKELLDYARNHQHTKVIIDGPYGGTDIVSAIQHSDRTCLIAGGSGISVTYPLSWTIQAENTLESIVSTRTVYASGQRHVSKITSTANVPNQEKHVHFWIRQERKHGQWITMLPKRKAMVGGMSTDTQGSETVEAVDLINRSFTTRDKLDGRPDISLEICEWIRGKSGRAVSNERICIVVSGPDDLAREVNNCAAKLSREYNIEIFVEKFGW